MASDDEAVISSGRFLNLVRRDGWEYVERANATGVVAVVAITEGGKLLVTEQYRLPVNRRVVDLPAGLAGDLDGSEDEEMAAAAQRELEEEVGYRAGSMEFLFRGPSSAGLTSEVITFFNATGLTRVSDGGGDDSEDIEVLEIPLDDFDEWAKAKQDAGVFIDPKILAGLYFAGRLSQSDDAAD